MISAPAPSELISYYNNYVKLVSGDVLVLLENQIGEVSDFFKKLDASKENYAYAQGKWTVKEVFAHIIDTERIMAYRTLSFSRGEIANLPPYDENLYIQNANIKSRSAQSLLDEYANLRRSNIALFKSFNEEQLSRKGIANNNPVTVRVLIYIIAGHELHHVNVLKDRY